MAENGDGGVEEFLKSLGTKNFEGKFLTRVKPEDLDEHGRFICEEPVIVIGSHAFEEVKDKLTYVKIFGVVSIEDEAFADCKFLRQADIDFELDYHYLQNYDAHMFWKNRVIDTEDDYEYALKTFSQKFGEYDVHIKDGAFNNCIRLERFRFPARVVLHGSPFRFCNSMTEISFDGAIRLQIHPQIVQELGEDEFPFRSVTFKDCDNVQKMNFGKGALINIDEIAPFYSLKEINLTCNFFDKRKFWKDAIASYPQFFLMLPSELYYDTSFAQSCLHPVSEVLEEVYGYPACKDIYKNLLAQKEKIEKQKAREKKKSLKAKRVDNGGGFRERDKN